MNASRRKGSGKKGSKSSRKLHSRSKTKNEWSKDIKAIEPKKLSRITKAECKAKG